VASSAYHPQRLVEHGTTSIGRHRANEAEGLQGSARACGRDGAGLTDSRVSDCATPCVTCAPQSRQCVELDEIFGVRANGSEEAANCCFLVLKAHHRISAQILPTPLRPIARAAPRDRSMSRPRVNGPRSLITTIVDEPVRGLETLTLVPNGSLLCAAVRPSARNGCPLAVCRPELY
jgi:hypothetical protein